MTFTSKHCPHIVLMFNLLVLIWVGYAFSTVQNLKRSNFLDLYAVYITNLDVDNLIVHCKSGDDDLGDKNLAPNQYFHWMFRQNFLLTTLYFCNFRWMTPDDNNREIKSASFHVFDIYISALCGDEFSVNRCYWLVRKDGFYFSKDDKPFPDGWKLMHTW